MIEVTKITDKEGKKWYLARQVFSVFGLSWSGEKSIYKKNIPQENYTIMPLNKKLSLFLDEFGVFKISAFGKNKLALDYFKNKKQQ
jgi:hypothetical protein